MSFVSANSNNKIRFEYIKLLQVMTNGGWRLAAVHRLSGLFLLLIFIALVITTSQLLQITLVTLTVTSTTGFLGTPNATATNSLVNVTFNFQIENLADAQRNRPSDTKLVMATKGKSIGIGCAVTSNGIEGLNAENIHEKVPFMYDFLPSFCRTASPGFQYHIYVSYDKKEPLFSTKAMINSWQKALIAVLEHDYSPNIQVHFHLVHCSHDRHPAWAQNDAMVEAYLDGMDYSYRINDDTRLTTKGWTEKFIAALARFDPPNIGVVGPTHHGGNMAIMTYDFTSRKHVEIFGFHYPRDFIDWFADDWVTDVYKPGRLHKLKNVHVQHTMYKSRYLEHQFVPYLNKRRLMKDRNTLQRYIAALKNNVPNNGSKIISMSLWGQSSTFTYGALRNAQLMKVKMPGWTLRIYLELPDANNVLDQIPSRYFRLFKQLGVQLHYINRTLTRGDPLLWRYLVADDKTVEYFLIRDANHCISKREKLLVDKWIASGKTFHCMRDHPLHANLNIVPALWGAKRAAFTQILGGSLHQIMLDYSSANSPELQEFLSDYLWSIVSSEAICHDSFSCNIWPNSLPIYSPRKHLEFLGRSSNPLSKGLLKRKEKKKHYSLKFTNNRTYVI